MSSPAMPPSLRLSRSWCSGCKRAHEQPRLLRLQCRRPATQEAAASPAQTAPTAPKIAYRRRELAPRPRRQSCPRR
jgi:hypothetical protein